MRMNSLAEWERAESPGPILSDGMPCISDMSEVVGDMNGVSPIPEAALTSGCLGSITEARMRVERGVRTE